MPDGLEAVNVALGSVLSFAPERGIKGGCRTWCQIIPMQFRSLSTKGSGADRPPLAKTVRGDAAGDEQVTGRSDLRTGFPRPELRHLCCVHARASRLCACCAPEVHVFARGSEGTRLVPDDDAGDPAGIVGEAVFDGAGGFQNHPRPVAIIDDVSNSNSRDLPVDARMRWLCVRGAPWSDNSTESARSKTLWFVLYRASPVNYRWLESGKGTRCGPLSSVLRLDSSQTAYGQPTR